MIMLQEMYAAYKEYLMNALKTHTSKVLVTNEDEWG